MTGFPQGSVLGPFSYPVYTAPLFPTPRKHDIPMCMYADDTQLLLSFEPNNSDIAIKKMNACIAEVSEWMKVKYLKLNGSKTEVMFIGSKSTLRKVEHIKTINIGDESIKINTSAKNIGVIFDETLSLSLHINNITKTCYYLIFFKLAELDSI